MESPLIKGRLGRVLTLLERIGSGVSLNADKLAEEFQLSRRTVFRDIELLRGVGVAIRFDGPHNGYELHSHNSQFRGLNDEEVLELIAHAESSVMPCSESQQKRVAHALTRLRASLPEELRNTPERSSAMSIVGRGGLDERERLDTLIEAISGNRAVIASLVEWTGYSEPEIALAPIRVEFRVGRWVLDGVRLRDHAKMRIVLDLINDLTVEEALIVPALASHLTEWTDPEIAILRSIKPNEE